MIGRTVSHYRVTDKIGIGGMGVVYKAEDVRLQRSVALKFLPDSLSADRAALERFRREARAASSLNHPHICVVHDFGEEDRQPYIVMEYLEGETLDQTIERRALPVPEILEIGLQVSDALDCAHAKGIVHRDIKPKNIFATKPCYVKVLDFGLAKLLSAIAPAGHTLGPVRSHDSDSALTGHNLMIGTIGYMSPEQVCGKTVDHRSDLFSFGAVLYEMTASRKAFSGETAAVVCEGILARSPTSIREINPAVPAELDRIIAKALEKDVDLRYQTAADLRADLGRLKRDLAQGPLPGPPSVAARPAPVSRRAFFIGTATGAGILAAGVTARYFLLPASVASMQSLAVMPFANLSGDPGTGYACDALTQGVTDSLSQLPDLLVPSRNAVSRYKGSSLDIAKIRSSLKVHGVLQGSVARQAGKLSMKVDLIDARTQKRLQTNEYMLEPGDFLPVQERIFSDISQTLRPNLTGEERQTLATYAVYQKARYYLNKRTPEGLKKAVEYFIQVIEKNPEYALAHAGLADCYNLLPVYSGLSPREAFPKAKQAAQTALHLDEGLAQAHTALALVRMNYDRDWVAAEGEFKRALELDPEYETAHQWYAEYLTNVGRFDQAITHMNWARELAPLSLIIHADLAWVLYCARRPDEALEQLRKTVNLDPDFAAAHWFLGWVYYQKRDFERSLSGLNKALQGGISRAQADIAFVRARSGDRAEALRILENLKADAERGNKYVSQFEYALIYTGLDDRDKAFAALDRAFEERPWDLASAKVDPLLDSLRSDRRFPEMLRRLGLPPA